MDVPHNLGVRMPSSRVAVVEQSNTASCMSPRNSYCLCELDKLAWKCSLDVCLGFILQVLPSQDEDEDDEEFLLANLFLSLSSQLHFLLGSEESLKCLSTAM